MSIRKETHTQTEYLVQVRVPAHLLDHIARVYNMEGGRVTAVRLLAEIPLRMSMVDAKRILEEKTGNA